MQEYGLPQEEQAPLGYRSASDLEREDEERKAAERDTGHDRVVDQLASHVRTCWEAAKQAKEASVEDRLYKTLRQRMGKYDPDVVAAITEQGGSSVYMMLTDEKCSAAESWLEDILMPVDDRPFAVQPTPVPDLPEPDTEAIAHQILGETQQLIMAGGEEPTEEAIAARTEEIISQIKSRILAKARKKATDCEDELSDILEEADWRSSFKEFLYYFVTFPAAFLKGPVLRTKPELIWGPEGAHVEEVIVKDFDPISPFDIYPSPTARGIDDGYLIERHRLTRSDLFGLIGTDNGYDDEKIREVLSDIGDSSYYNWLDYNDDTRDNLEGRERKELDPEGKIDALQFWGGVSGDKLLEWGLEDDDVKLDSEREYEAEVWLINNIVIKAVINPDPLGKKPYYKASFRELYGQFWGIGLPEIIRDSQLMCNAAARNMANNMAIASGPQVGVDVSMMPEGEDYSEIIPWKVWPFDMSQGPSSAGGRQPIWFFYPPSMVNELLSIYQKFSDEADTKSGIPKYTYGSKETGGPLSTATGFSMMMDNAARGIKKVVRNVDQGVIRPMLQHLYRWMMLYEEGFAEKYGGDIKIIARGSSALVAKEQKQMRMVEVLQMVLASPQLETLAGLPGIADIFRKVLQGVDIGVDDVVPTNEEIRVMQKQQAEAAAQMAEEERRAQAQGAPGPPQGRQRNYAGESR